MLTTLRRVVRAAGSPFAPRIGWLVLALTIVSCSPSEKPRPEARPPAGRPSLLVVTLDTTRPDRLGPYGGPQATSPHLSELARDGAVFERAYAVAPITLPAHTSIFTGLYPPQHRVRNNGIDRAASDLETLAERARSSGYRTGAFVGAAVLDSRYGLDQGFETYDDGLEGGRTRDRWGIHERPAGRVADSALAWLDSLPASEPFFAWVHFFDAHAPWQPPSPYKERFANDPYNGELAYQDAQLGRLLASPRIGRDVIVAVLGDHGEALGQHGESTHGILVYDSTLRIPWILRGPGVPAGGRIRTPVSQVDVLPTLLTLLGLPKDGTLPGTDRLQDDSPAAALYAESRQPVAAYGWSPLQAMVRGSWKLIRGVDTELYDLDADPAERSDVAPSQPQIVRELSRELEAYADEGSTGRTLEEENLAALRSLGYLATGRATPSSGSRLRDPRRSIDIHEELLSLFGHAGGAPRDVVPALRDILERDPGNLTALQELPRALLEAGRWTELEQAVDQAIRAGADPAPLWLLAARGERRRGDAAAALALLDRAIEEDASLFPLWLEKISLLLAQGDAAAARRAVEAARPLHGSSPWLGVQIARLIELPEGRTRDAERRLREVLDNDPQEIEAYGVLADLLVGDDRASEAAGVLRAGLERNPDAASLHSRLGFLLAAGSDLAAAETHLARALELTPEPRPDLRAALDSVMARRASPSADRPLGKSERPLANGSLEAQLEAAEERLEDQLEENPADVDTLFQLAALALERGDPAGAEAHLRQALEVDPRQAAIWNDLGLMIEQQGRLDEARECYAKALEVEPRMLQAMINLGVLARRQGRWEEAAAHFEQALKQPGAPPDVDLELANLYGGPLRRATLARSHYEAFLLASPSDPRAPLVRERLRALGGN